MSGEEDDHRCGSTLFLSLPDDVLGLISDSVRPKDLCSLALCCRGLRAAVSSSEKVWIAQCRRLGGASLYLLPRWRAGVRSYRALCRFLAAVAPLLGIWVHQNPELGNVVCVVWGFLSVVGCRVIPQELGPLGLDAGPLLWAPVFEIVADSEGAASCFFLHGRGREGGGEDSLYPGSIKSIDPSCNVLLLEVDVRQESPFQAKQQLLHTLSFAAASENRESSSGIRFCRSDTTISRSSSLPTAPVSLLFSRLAFGDRRKLLDIVAGRVRLKVPTDLAASPLFPCSSPREDTVLLAERRLSLIQMHKCCRSRVDWKVAELQYDSIELSRISDGAGGNCTRCSTPGKRRSFSFSVAGYFKDGLRQIIGRSSSGVISRGGGSPATGESKHVQLHEFLRRGDTIGLSLRAVNMKLSTYRAWPYMHDGRFALYKLPMQDPTAGREYAGLWGGTFGWPPGRPAEDKPGKALFFLLLSYEEVDGHLLLIATKILEGTHYVLHPNGSAMFIVKVDEPSLESFPWETDGDSLRIEVKHTYNGDVEVMHSYSGEGIANGYGFQYPGSKPGSLFVMQNGLLAFVWKESRVVLTLQRLNLQELLKKGERVPTLPPIANFAYLTKSYSNVFAGVSSNPFSPRIG